MTNTSATPVDIWPVFEVDFNSTRGRGGVWTVISDFELTAWSPLVGREVIVAEESEDLRFYGTVTSVKPAKHAADRWVIDVQVGPEWLSAKSD